VADELARSALGRAPLAAAFGGEVLWAYCVVPAAATLPSDVHRVVGVGAAVERVQAGELAALVSRVPRAEFGAEPLRRNLNELHWLEHIARAHVAVLDRLLEATTVVPLRLCTIYETEASVRAMLERETETLRGALAQLVGRQEWAVKLQLVREVADALAMELAEDVHARLQELAIAAVTLPPQNRELSGHEGEMVLNGAYLVEVDRVDALRGLVSELTERHRALGARVELTGPWPPYNFVPDESGALE
jgi:Gas vesicle synthesis protein GvpL/GvpF